MDTVCMRDRSATSFSCRETDVMDMSKLSERQKLNVVEYVPPPPGADSERVIELLEKMLEDARNGDIVGIGVAAVRANGFITTAWHSGNRWSAVVASVSTLAFRLHDECK